MKKLVSFFLCLLMLFFILPFASFAAPADGEALELTWNKGTYYESLNTSGVAASNRRYTVIPCGKGERFVFNIPGADWRLYVYLADASGVITYFQPKNGMEYTVEDFGGRMPSELRVTAYPYPDGQITDAMWAAFDVVIEKFSAVSDPDDIFSTTTWNKGAFYDTAEPNTSLAASRRYTVVPCKEGQVFTFKKPSSWTLFVYPADENGSINGEWFSVGDGMTYEVAAIAGRIPTSLRVTACPRPDGTLTDEMWQLFDAECRVSTVSDSGDLFATAIWNKGAFYDTAEPNTSLALSRRYTVIPCKEGQTFTFRKPSSDWILYVYPADADGSINGNWFEVKNGMEYTVAATNGRVPTSLRVTARPNPEGEISDIRWKLFNASCYLEGDEEMKPEVDYNLFRTAVWKNGAYFGNEVHVDSNRKYAVFPCEKDDTFRFEFNGTDFGLLVYYYDENGELTDFGYTAVTEDGEIKITEKNGKIPSELRITVYPIAEQPITDELWSKFDVACIRSSNHIKVASMNYGLWNNGVTAYVEDSRVESVLAAWKQMLDDHNVDILAGQEWLRFFDRSNTLTAEKALFAYKYRYQYAVSTGNGKNLVSKTECTDFAAHTFSTNIGRQYTKVYTMINGKKVCLINAHCSLEADFTIHRKAEFEELIRIMDQEEYVILFGDFNAYDASEFDLFKTAGYSVSNGGAFGNFDTWTNFGKESSSWANKVIDNVIVSPNIRILGVEVDRRDLSDHSMLVAELLLLDAIPEAEPVERAPGITAETVMPQDKEILQRAKADLEKALADQSGYTGEEVKQFEDDLKRVNEALKALENVEAVKKEIEHLPETITEKDKEAVKAAQDAYDALSEHERSLVDESCKKKLDQAQAALAELEKPPVSGGEAPPETGDAGRLSLWFSLLAVSGTVLAFLRRKQKASK